MFTNTIDEWVSLNLIYFGKEKLKDTMMSAENPVRLIETTVSVLFDKAKSQEKHFNEAQLLNAVSRCAGFKNFEDFKSHAKNSV